MEPIKVFLSYADEDEKLLQQLEKHLSVFRRSGKIILWHGKNTAHDTEWQREIETYLNTADIILLLISPDFIASDHCYSIEMQKALERYKAGDARVMPILMRPVDASDTPLRELPMLPASGQAVTRWRDQDEALLEISLELGKAIKEVRSAMNQLSTDKVDDHEQNVDLGKGTLIVHTDKTLLGRTIDLHEGSFAKSKFHSSAKIVERKIGEVTVYEAVFQSLNPNDYMIFIDWRYFQRVVVFANAVLEIDWREGSPALKL